MKDSFGITPLHLGSGKSIKICKTLLENGADVNARTNNGITPLHLASGSGFADVVELLVEYRADVNVKINDGVTPLHMASRSGAVAVVKILMANGADYDAKNEDGMTAHQLAQETNCSEMETEMENTLRWEGEAFHIKKWLTEFISNEPLLAEYYDCLKEDGWESMEMLELLEEEDLDFMDDHYAKLTMKKVAELKNKNSV